MERTITVSGMGKTSVSPDRVVLTMTVEVKDKMYQKAVDGASRKIAKLREAFEPLGFDADALKTERFAVRSDYRFHTDRKGNHARVFDGFVCTHQLSLGFDFCTDLLGRAISVISESLSNPQLNIKFTVSDSESVCSEVIADAARNARARAQVLCEASGTTLGKLVKIDYNIKQIDVFSHIDFRLDNDVCCEPQLVRCTDMNITPSDIDVCDNVTFVWEIE
ncbi:MAG: SIMPL domain-containing protein [Clostridia bacterium]|nr:SIMPL domain-containing protein [Clostridia bacterium]